MAMAYHCLILQYLMLIWHQEAIFGATTTKKPTTKLTSDFGTVLSLNRTIKQQLIDSHNMYRAFESATNMRAVTWDDRLEKLAADWARRCDGTHRPTEQRKNIGPYWYVGENLYWDSNFNDKYKPKKAVQAWYAEKPYYVFEKPGNCTGGVDCLHYSQVVWADTCTIGCAVATCNKIRNGRKVKSGFMVVCCYGPGGNIIHNGVPYKPYKKGAKKCSECKGKCVNNLCQDKCTGKS